MRAKATPEERKEQRRDARKAQVALAARSLMGELGYEGTTVDLVAERAGLSKSTLYVYFDSKEEILAACFAQGREELFARIDAALERTTEPEAQLVALFRETIAHFDEHAPFLRAVVSLANAWRATEPGGSRPLADLSHRFGERVNRILGDGIASGVLEVDDMREASIALGSLMQGVLSLRAPRQGPGRSPEEEAKAMVGFVLRGIRARG